jgi:hypothetical protein
MPPLPAAQHAEDGTLFGLIKDRPRWVTLCPDRVSTEDRQSLYTFLPPPDVCELQDIVRRRFKAR